jgi:DNA helicase-2/ATP-dependent DNA helicase PcrA
MALNSNFLNDLNPVQQEASKSFKGPTLIIAGAGSGKTRVLTYRIAYMIQQGIDPFNILSLTFTNKAAKEMKERITNLLGGSEARNVWMGTFHSIFARILRIDGHLLGYTQSYTIYDIDDVKSLLKAIVKELDLDIKAYSPNYLIGRISMAKNNLISDTEYNQNTEIITTDAATQKPRTGEIYSIYNKRLRKSNAMDFDDLLFNTNVLLRDFPEILFKYQQKFKYILVDEYQDTNHAQYLILKKLSAANENICVVGDDAQSIYAFRGANIQNILNFKKNYSDYKLYKLEQNYRSTKNIVNAANSVIKKNQKQIEKDIWTDNDEGEKITIIRAESENNEGLLIAQSIFENREKNQLQNSDFAILYRTNAQSRAFEESLRKLNIPYQIFGGLSFYKRKEIKDLIAYFRLTINHYDEEALKRIINYPARGLGQTTVERIVNIASEKNVSIWDVVENPKGYDLPVNLPTQDKLSDFAVKIKSFTAQLKTSNAYDLAFLIAQSTGVLSDLQEKSKEEPEHLQNAEALLNAMQDFVDSETENQIDESEVTLKTLDLFLSEVSLMTDIEDVDKDKNKDVDFNKVSLMTIHSAKGLEFGYVYIVGLEEQLFPSFMSVGSRSELEEERRLFYVALTRAENKAYLSYADGRMRWGQYNFTEPSRFIDDIDPKFIEMAAIKEKQPSSVHREYQQSPKGASYNFDSIKAKQSNVSPISKTIASKPNFTNLKKVETAKFQNTETSNINLIIPGIDVEHAKFGLGHVISVEGDANNKKAIIFFDGIGEKTLLLQYAKLTVL